MDSGFLNEAQSKKKLMDSIAEALHGHGGEEYEIQEGSFSLKAEQEDPEVEVSEDLQELNTQETKAYFGAIVEELKESLKGGESEDEEMEEDSSSSKEIKPKAKEETESLFEFSDEEIKAAIHGMLKRTKFSKVYDIFEGFTIKVADVNDNITGILNKEFADIIDKGERRVSVRVVDPYTNSEGKFVPGGRIEEEYKFNPDGNRLNMRALTAAYLSHIDGVPLKELKTEEDLRARLEVLDEYSTEFLDVIYNKAIVPFMALMKEASARLLKVNF